MANFGPEKAKHAETDMVKQLSHMTRISQYGTIIEKPGMYSDRGQNVEKLGTKNE